MRPEFLPGCRRLDTSFLPGNISVSDSDWSVSHSSNLNRVEFKRYEIGKPVVLNRCQLLQFQAGHFHVVAINSIEPKDATLFWFVCPSLDYQTEWIENYGWRIRARARRLERKAGRRVLAAYEPFPCCGQFTFQGKSRFNQEVKRNDQCHIIAGSGK